MLFLFFFFSSRRRHTRSLCDWSSDVCSSDLEAAGSLMRAAESRGLKTSRVARVVVSLRNGGGGAKFVLMSFVHAARKPEIGLFIRAAHMTGGDGLFKAGISLIPPNDE